MESGFRVSGFRVWRFYGFGLAVSELGAFMLVRLRVVGLYSVSHSVKGLGGWGVCRDH